MTSKIGTRFVIRSRIRDDAQTSRSGGIGRRDGFKIRFPQGSEGSSPSFGIQQANFAEEFASFFLGCWGREQKKSSFLQPPSQTPSTFRGLRGARDWSSITMPCSTHPGDGEQSPHSFHKATSGEPLVSDEQVACYFALLAGQVRMQILRRLAHGPSSVTALANDIQVSITLISYNLQKLNRAGLVKVRPRARQRVYRLDGSLAKSVDGCLHLRVPLGPQWRAEISAPHFSSKLAAKGVAEILPEAVDRLLHAATSPTPPSHSVSRHRTGGHSPRRSTQF
jgi:DNA-binding transcriptional ArsR family regulator